MTEHKKNPIIDPTWMAITKGDKKAAEKYLLNLGVKLYWQERLTVEDSRLLGCALMQFKGNPASFFGYSRSGQSSTKTLEQLEIWKTVKKYKRHLKAQGLPQVDAFAHVAQHLDLTDSKVKDDYESVQHYVINQKQIRKDLLKGIAAL